MDIFFYALGQGLEIQGFLLFTVSYILSAFQTSKKEVTHMSKERTLSIIKPDAVGNNNIGDIIGRFEKGGLQVVAAHMTHLSEKEAQDFYAVHKERPFFGDLVNFMTTGPVLVMVLEGEDAIKKNRDIMGATNPAEAASGTIRADFASTIDENAVHGSDSAENAAIEIAFFFKNGAVCPRTR